MKKLLFVYVLLIGTFILYVFSYQNRDANGLLGTMQGGLRGEIHEKYVMVTFKSGIEYWKSALKGFEDAAQHLNVSVEFRGATNYDVNEVITVLEQVIARNPAGIALSAIDPEALITTINKAVDAGIPVVLFDSGAPKSKALSFLGTNNYSAGEIAARELAALTGGKGKVAAVTLSNHLNQQERVNGFRDTLLQEYPHMQLVAIKDGKGDELAAGQAALELLEEHPDLAGIFASEAIGGFGIGEALNRTGKQLKIIGFDTDKRTLDLVKNGTISATLAQDTWNMGYWSLQYLFHLHHQLASPSYPLNGDVSPLPVYVDTGITIVNQSNVDLFYAK